MLLKITQSLIFRFSNRTQNFFEINPVFPDHSQKDFQLYNTQRKKIYALQAFNKTVKRTQDIKQQISKKLWGKKPAKLKKKKQMIQFDPVFDKESDLLQTDNEFLQKVNKQFKIKKKLGKVKQGDYNQLISSLVQKFKVRNQPDLLRLLRLNIASAKTKSLEDQIRQQIITNAVLEASKQAKHLQIEAKLQIKSEQKFKQILKQIDEKIQKLQFAMYPNNIIKPYKKYHPKYGKMPIDKTQINEKYSFITQNALFEVRSLNSIPEGNNSQDWSIQRKISRLYFLQRAKHFQKPLNKQFEGLIQANDFNKVVNEIAIHYNEPELENPPNIEEIYRDIETYLSKKQISLLPGKNQKQQLSIINRHLVKENLLNQEDLIWTNISAQEVYPPTTFQTTLRQDQVKQLSPNPTAQLSLAKIPFNLYRNNQFQIFGVFNKYRSHILTNFMKNQPINLESQFKYYDVKQGISILHRSKRQTQPKKRIQAKATRKSCFARCTIKEGTGIVTVNGQNIRDYFFQTYYRAQALKALAFTQQAGNFDVTFLAIGGGIHAQSLALGMALAKCLAKHHPDNIPNLKAFGYLIHDYRKKQPKRIGLYSARVRPPYVRR